MTHKEKEYLLYGGIAVGGIVLLVASRGGGPPPSHNQFKHSNAPSLPNVPNPNQSTLDEQIIQAKTAALNAYDQAVVEETGTRAQVAETYNTNSTNKQIAFNTNQTQLQETKLQTTVEQAIANIEAQAQESVASTNANALTTLGGQQQSSSWFQSIFGFLGNIFPFLAGGL